MKQTFDLDEIMFKLLNVKTITDEKSDEMMGYAQLAE